MIDIYLFITYCALLLLSNWGNISMMPILKSFNENEQPLLFTYQRLKRPFLFTKVFYIVFVHLVTKIQLSRKLRVWLWQYFVGRGKGS